jgi:hypothetical protein
MHPINILSYLSLQLSRNHAGRGSTCAVYNLCCLCEDSLQSRFIVFPDFRLDFVDLGSERAQSRLRPSCLGAGESATHTLDR